MAQPFAEPCSIGVIQAATPLDEPTHTLPKCVQRGVLASCILASSMAFIDSSALTVALPQLRASVGTDLTTVQWVINGYVLALASLTLTGGALADSYGKARVLGLGCLLFGAASLACALVPSIGWLIATRIVQGIGAALLTPASLALIGAVYPKSQRNGAIGAWAAASALTTAAGPVLGGWLTQTFGWQAVFLINPPLAIIVALLLVRFAPSESTATRHFDVVGAGLIALALAALAWALSGTAPVRGASTAVSTPHLATIAAGVFGIIGIIGYAHWERTTNHPMTPPRFVRNRVFFGLNLATFLLYGGLAIMFFLTPFELIDRRGLGATEAGLVFMPFTLGVGLLSRPFGALADTVGARVMLVVGAGGAAVAYLWLALAQHCSLIVGVIAPMTLLGLSFAVMVAPLTASVLSSVTASDEGLASGVNNAASRIAQLTGVALAAGFGASATGYSLGLLCASAASAAAALVAVRRAPSMPRKSSQPTP